MRKVQPRWRELVRSVNRWETIVEYSNDGGANWDRVRYVDGTIKADATSQVRWTTSGLVLECAPSGRNGINALTSRIRIRNGIRGHQPITLGVYRVRQTQRSVTSATRLHVECESFESYVIDADFERPRGFRTTTSGALTSQLVKEVLPRATIVWRDGVDYNTTVPKLSARESRWALIDGDRDDPSVAKAVGGVIYCGGAGEWVVSPPGSLQDQPTFEIERGGLLLDSTVGEDRDDVYNAVVVKGEPQNRAPVGPVVVRDTDVHSATYYYRTPDEGGFGPRPLIYTAPTIVTVAQAGRVAQRLLDQHLGLRRTATFTSLHDPSIEPGDVGEVDTPDGPRRFIVDAITYDPQGGDMQATLRSTTTKLV